MTGAGAAELEIKLRLARSAVAAVLRHPALAAVKRGRARTATLRSTYFDTEGGRLVKSGIGLRLRRDGRRWVQTLKGPLDARSGAGLAARPEYEWPLRAGIAMPPVDAARFALTPWRRKLDKAMREGLRPRFSTVFERTSVPLVFADSTMAMLAIDTGEIRAAAGGARVGVCEIEIELESGHAHNLFDLARALAQDLPVALETRSKAARGNALLVPAPRTPVRAEDPDLEGRSSTADALAALLRSCVRQIDANADGVIDDDDPEWVHQMRIGTRRLRACLSLMRDLVPADTLAPLRAEARWLARTLGAVRDLDVLVDETLPAIAAAVRGASPGGRAPALRSLRTRAARQRAAARSDARAAVASRRFVRFLLAVGGFAARPRFGADEASAAAATLALPARRVARPVLKRRQRKLLDRGTNLPAATPAARHAARLAAKRLRYATEFFAALFPRRKTRAYRAALARLQELLGVMNDASMAADLAAGIAGEASPAAATLRGWAAAQAAARADALADTWQDFNRARPFWSGA
ncbi:MAG: CYTH and CHAD domain-containing protein [Casimicrobiaceae bacterium]